jgi:hypothetical protein
MAAALPRDFHLINPAATPFDREQRPDPAILLKKQAPATGRLVKYETRLCTEYQSVLSGGLLPA